MIHGVFASQFPPDSQGGGTGVGRGGVTVGNTPVGTAVVITGTVGETTVGAAVTVEGIVGETTVGIAVTVEVAVGANIRAREIPDVSGGGISSIKGGLASPDRIVNKATPSTLQSVWTPGRAYHTTFGPKCKY